MSETPYNRQVETIRVPGGKETPCNRVASPNDRKMMASRLSNRENNTIWLQVLLDAGKISEEELLPKCMGQAKAGESVALICH